MSQDTSRSRYGTDDPESVQQQNQIDQTRLLREYPITLTGVFGLLIISAALGWYTGPIGLIAAVPIALTWLVASGALAVPVAVITVSALTSVHTPMIFVMISIGALAMFVGDVPVVVRSRPIELLGGAVTAILGFAVIAYGAYMTLGAGAAPFVLAMSFSIAAYTLYRYTIVRHHEVEAT